MVHWMRTNLLLKQSVLFLGNNDVNPYPWIMGENSKRGTECVFWKNPERIIASICICFCAVNYPGKFARRRSQKFTDNNFDKNFQHICKLRLQGKGIELKKIDMVTGKEILECFIEYKKDTKRLLIDSVRTRLYDSSWRSTRYTVYHIPQNGPKLLWQR